MKALSCSQTISRLIGEILPAANHSRDRFSRLMASMGNEEHLPIKEAERSHNDIAKLLRRALRVKLAAASVDGDSPWCDCIDFYPSTLVYMVRGVYYEAPYSIDEAGTVTIGDPVEVIPTVTYQPAVPAATVVPAAASETSREASQGELGEIIGPCIDLSEAQNFVNLQESKATIRIATPGWGSTGFYSADVLKRDGPKIFPAGTHMFWNHPTESENAERPEGDLDRLAAVTTVPAFWQQNGADGPGLYTTAALRERYAPDVAELKDHIGVSLRALGRFSVGKAEGKEGVIIEELVQGKSVDFVTRAGRGGKVLELFESAGRRQPAIAAVESRREVDDMAMTPEETRQLQEATEAAQTATTTSNRLANELLMMRSERFVREFCESYSLPLAVRKRVVSQMSGNPIVKNGAIDEAPFSEAIKTCISNELAYLKEAGVSGVSGFGPTSQAQEETLTLEEAEKELKAALAEFKA